MGRWGKRGSCRSARNKIVCRYGPGGFLLDPGRNTSARDDRIIIITEPRHVSRRNTDAARKRRSADILLTEPVPKLHEGTILPSVKFIKRKNEPSDFTMGLWLKISGLAYLHPMARKRSKPKVVTHFLREWRESKGLSQERLAARVDMSPALISRLENGSLKFTEETLYALADALQCEPGDILSRDPAATDFQLWRIINGMTPTEQEQALRLIEALKPKVA